ncbi:glycosyltransferase family 4 protein [Candidatus Daviesbacteria bacterium]|nr:glycosyltransferase family 4 protein [Candidatus Daviesbacteria bacterium]
MNIGFDASRAFIPSRTGTENYSYQLLKHLAKIDHHNQYLVYLRPNLATQGSTLRGWPKNFKFITIPFKRLWTQVGLAKQTFQDSLDVLFVPAHTLPLIHKPGLKTVLTIHDLGAEYLPKMHQLKQRLYLKFMTNYQIKSATKLIAVSNSTKNDLISQVGVNGKKISVVYEGYDQDLFKPVKSDRLNSIVKQYDLKPKNYFLFVGTIQPRKNLARLILAYEQFLRRGGAEEGSRRLARIPSEVEGEDGRRDTGATGPRRDPHLVLVGNKGWSSEEIYQLPKKLGIGNQVKFLGFVPDQDLPALYSGAQAFLFPSLYEGFGLPVLEAFACGTPVLTSNTSSLPEVAGKAAILVNPTSVEEISKGIAKLTTNHQLTKLGFEQIKKFSWEKAARETLDILM